MNEQRLQRGRAIALGLLGVAAGFAAVIASTADAGTLRRRASSVATRSAGPFPATLLAQLQEPGRSLLGRETSAGGSPFEVRASGNTLCTGYACLEQSGIAVVFNRDLSPPCESCTYPTVSSDGARWTMVSGDGAGWTAGVFSQPTPSFAPAAGWVISTCTSGSLAQVAARGAVLMLATDFNPPTYNPRGAPGLIGYVWDSTDAVGDGLYWCTAANTCTALGAAAPRDDREYCALLAGAACAGVACNTAGYAVLVDMTNPAAPTVAHEAVGFSVASASPRFLERNINPCTDGFGCTPVTTATRYLRGVQAFAL